MSNFSDEKRPEKLSENMASQWLDLLRDLIDSRIEQRIASNNLIKARDAKITSISEGGVTATLICDDIYYDAKNCTGVAFTASDINKWVKMITYDNVQYFVLHKIEPEVVDTEGLKKEILDEVKDYVSGSIIG